VDMLISQVGLAAEMQLLQLRPSTGSRKQCKYLLSWPSMLPYAAHAYTSLCSS
jgi:hypothetical protein